MKRIDLVGQKFGRLTIVRFDRVDKFRKIVWLCKCDCGNEHFATTDILRRGNTKSCGCYRDTFKLLPGDEGSFNTTYSQYEANSRNRGYAFSLSKDEFRKITSKSCIYCGSKPKPYFAKNRAVVKVVPYFCNGIDRVDNSVGYEYSNCVSCCDLCNYMKRSMTADDFLTHVNKIVSYSRILNGEFAGAGHDSTDCGYSSDFRGPGTST